MAKKYYAYFLDDNNKGVFDNWEACKEVAYPIKARYKSFKNIKEAEKWIEEGGVYEIRQKKDSILSSINLEEAIYFDAGTGRGKGVEVRVTNKNKESLFYIINKSSFKKLLSENNWFLNEYKNIQLDETRTNNFGELLGLHFAIECARKMKINKIFGDSNLVIKYWSKGFYHPEKLSEDTIKFIELVIKERQKFEKEKGSIEHISGDINPADLGFHK